VRHKGHSKWQNIKATKGANDLIKSKIASLYSYKVSVAIKSNGNETRVEYNKELERTIKAGLAAGVMRKTLENAVKRFKEMDQVETVIEITGPGNSKILVETLAKSAKHANNVFLGITKKKGGMMDPGRCRVMFDHRGQIIAKPPQSAGYSTDIAEEDAIEIGAEEADFDSESGLVEFLCGVYDFPDVMSAAEEKNFDVISAKVAYIPKQYVDITTARETEAFNKLIESLENCDNTTAVHHNVDEMAA